jgi:hypothetical protein
MELLNRSLDVLGLAVTEGDPISFALAVGLKINE